MDAPCNGRQNWISHTRVDNPGLFYMNELNECTIAEQPEIERMALGLLQRPEINEAYKKARQLFLADPLAKTLAGRETLDQAVDELVLSIVYDTLLNDLSKPRLLWMANAPHSWFGHSVSGARYGLDNPDNVYRAAAIDPKGSYEIRARHIGPLPAHLSVQLYPNNRYGAVLVGAPTGVATTGVTAKPQQLDQPLGGLLDHQILMGEDGSFTVTINPEPANGRANHIQSQEGANALLIRSSLSDWQLESPYWLAMRRLDPAPPPMSEKSLAVRAIERLEEDVPFWLRFNHEVVFSKTPNTLPIPRARGGGWGFSCISNFDLADDEGLLITIHPQGARYTGFQISCPWSITYDHIDQTGSLNNVQTRPNNDGSFTYVIAAKDPGLANWLNSSGMPTGAILLRWQSFPEQPATADGLVREVKLIKLAQLPQWVADKSMWLTPEQRKQELANRARGYNRRLSDYLIARPENH